MDYDIPDDINYLPKPRNGFALISGPQRSSVAQARSRPKPNQKTTTTTTTTKKTATQRASMNPSQTKKTTTQRASINPSQTKKTIKNTPMKASTLQPKKVTTQAAKTTESTSVPTKNPQTTKKIETIKTKTGETQKVVSVYPTKGKILSKVPDSKFKPVKAGPREDPNLVRTEKEEILEFLRLTNEFRKQNNLSELKLNDEMSEIARHHNEDMMNGKTHVGHEGFIERSSQIKHKKAAGENCAMYVGPREHLTTLMENLINSPPHKANLLGSFNEIGIAIGKNSENMWYVTQLFARF